MSTIQSSTEHLTLNADGASKDIKFQANGVEVSSISSAGAFTSTSIDATKLTGALPAIDGSALTGLGGGVTEIDRWYLNTGATIPAADTDLTANLARATLAGWTKLGTGMTEASGIFSFPSTGFWEITSISNYYIAAASSRYIASRIMTTIDNSTWVKTSETYASMASLGGTYQGSTNKLVFEVTNTTLDKVKFQYYSVTPATLDGNKSSSFIFTKLAEL